MSEENNRNNNNSVSIEERAFTQDEVNRIVSERVAKEKAKYEYELGKRDRELSRRSRVAEIGLRLNRMGFDGADGIAEVWADLPDDTAEKNITALDKAIRDTIQREIDGRLRAKAPAKGAAGGADSSIRRAMGLK